MSAQEALPKEQILEIAKLQRYMIFMLIYYVLLYGVPMMAPLAYIFLAAFSFYFILKLSKALNYKHPIVLSILSLLPLLGLIILLLLNSKATSLLRDAKLKVTFFGCDKDELERFARSKSYGSF